MVNPLRIQTETTPDSLKQMSDAEMDWCARLILDEFASSESGTGCLSINPSPNTGLTHIGTIHDYYVNQSPLPSFAGQYASSNFNPGYQTFFSGFGGSFFANTSENYQGQYGTDPLRSYAPTAGYTGNTYILAYRDANTNYAGTAYGNFAAGYLIDPSVASGPTAAPTYLTEVEYQFFQDLRAADETGLVRPLEWISGQGIKSQVDASLNAAIVQAAMDRLVNDGVGRYQLAVSAPAVSGTWIAVDTITDTITDESNITYTLWRKTAEADSATEFRPIKYRTIGNQFSLIEMTDAEIELLTQRLRNQIVDTGVGQYRVQENAPSTGTWVTAGDVIRDQLSPTYVGTFSTTYGATYAGTGYQLQYQTFYSGFGGTLYAHRYTGETSYTSPNYTTDYATGYQTFYSGFGGTVFNAFFTSPNYTTDYTPTYAAEFYQAFYASAQYAGTFYQQGFVGTGADNTDTTNFNLWFRTA